MSKFKDENKNLKKENRVVYQDCVMWISENKKLKQRIADLEAKLAESEEKNKQLVKALNGEVFVNYKLPMENAQLKQQLAEKETETKSLTDEISSLEQHLTHYQGECFNLKDHLAEKDKEIESFKFKLELRAMNLHEINMERFALENQVKNHNQDKIELLENLKQTFAWGKDNGYLTPENAVNIIDQKIKEIKGE